MDISWVLIWFFLFTLTYATMCYISSFVWKGKNEIKVDYTKLPTVTVMLSAFNEGEAVYDTLKSAAQSDYPAELFDIIACDDCSKDDTWEWMQKAQAEFPFIQIFKNEVNKGKAPTLAWVAKKSKQEILISIDADCVLDPQAVRELAASFADPTVGGVGGLIGIKNVNDNLLTQMQTVLYNADFNLLKPMENMTRNVQCLGGPLVAYRRDIYLNTIPRMENFNFLGEKILIGEDRVITQDILMQGYGTFITFRAKDWSGTPVSWANFFRQQLRWRRSATGQWFYTLMHLNDFIKSRGIICAAGSVVPMLANFTWLAFLIFLFSTGMFLGFMATQLVAFFFIMPLYGLIFNLTTARKDPRQKLKNPILSSWVMALWFVVSVTVVTPWALFTLDDGGWVTRQNGMKGNA